MLFNLNTFYCYESKIISNLNYKLEDSKKILGSVFCEHARSIDYEEREMKYVEKASDNDLISILTLFNACL